MLVGKWQSLSISQSARLPRILPDKSVQIDLNVSMFWLNNRTGAKKPFHWCTERATLYLMNTSVIPGYLDSISELLSLSFRYDRHWLGYLHADDVLEWCSTSSSSSSSSSSFNEIYVVQGCRQTAVHCSTGTHNKMFVRVLKNVKIVQCRMIQLRRTEHGLNPLTVRFLNPTAHLLSLTHIWILALCVHRAYTAGSSIQDCLKFKTWDDTHFTHSLLRLTSWGS